MSTVRVRVALQPAYLLHHREYRDTSRLLELITRDHGRIGLVARGIRSRGSKLRPILQSFRPLFISWTARGDLGTLTGAELAMPAPDLPAERLYSAYYLNELVLRLTRRHELHRELFENYSQTLAALADGKPEARTLRLFEKRLLEALGYGLELRRTVSGGRVASGQQYEYRLEQGLVEAGPDRDDAMTYSGDSLMSLSAEDLSAEQSIRDARRLLQTALAVYLGPRPLKVQQVSRAIRRNQQ